MPPANTTERDDLVYGVEETPRSWRDWGLYSVQWAVTMVYAVVWGFAIVGVSLGFEGDEFTSYMAAVVLTIGVSTLTQAVAGHRFAMVSGPNVIPSLAIVAAMATGGREYALQAFTAQAIAGVLIAGLAAAGAVTLIAKVWSPLILGAMVMMVGLVIAATGLELMTQGGFDLAFILAAAVALGGTVLAIRGRGVVATLAPLFVIGVGYLAFIAIGQVDWTPVQEAPLFALPSLFPYGLAMPPVDLILIMLVVNLMAALNFYGNLTGYANVVKGDVEEAQTRRSFTLFGLVETTLPGILGVPATVSYGENLGIVMLTRVAARAFIVVAAVAFIVLAFVGPVGGLMAAMPEPIAGAVLLGIASTVIGIGADVMSSAPAFGRREQTLVGFSIFLALGLSLLPEEVWATVPRLVSTVFSNAIVSVILFVLVFEQLIFRQGGDGETSSDERETDDQETAERPSAESREQEVTERRRAG